MYHIITDSAIDMQAPWVEAQQNFAVVPLAYMLDGQAYTPDGSDAEAKRIYALLREGKNITTSQVPPGLWADAFRAVLAKGEDVLAIAFSSGLSGTCASAMAAADEVRSEYPDRKIRVVDSLCASAGEGLLVHYAIKNREQGMSIEENAAWVERNVQNVLHWFTVNDLMHLYRGGRVSAASAYIGTLAHIKPIMYMDATGKLALWEKAAGRKRSIHVLADKVRQHIVNPEGQIILISHGDCAEEAQPLADAIQAALPVAEVRLSYVGSVIGAHTGPGVIAVFCLGNGRTPKK